MSACNAATTDRLSGCLAQCILPKGHDDMHTDGGDLSWVDAPGSKYAAFVARMADGDLPNGLLATAGQPSPYSDAAVEEADRLLTPEALRILQTPTPEEEDPLGVGLRQRIRELEADLAALREEIATDPRHSHATEMIRRNERLEADLQEMRDVTRRDVYKNILAGLGVDYEDDASAMTLLIQVNAEVERAVELRETARAAVEAFEDQEGSQVTPCLCGGLATTVDNGGKTRCDVHPNGGEDLTYAPAWRRLCALVEGK